MTEHRRQYLKEYCRKQRETHPEKFICYWLQYYVKKAKEWKQTDIEKYNTILNKVREMEQELNK